MFFLYVNDEPGEVADVSINYICFFLLRFADDMVISNNPIELQTLLEKLHLYSSEWGLKVNNRKTKICVFENRRTQRKHIWSINGEPLEIVDSFLLFRNLEPGIKARIGSSFESSKPMISTVQTNEHICQGTVGPSRPGLETECNQNILL